VALIDVGGVELYVEEVGRGSPALVLHGGLGVDHRMCRALDPLGDRLRLVYVDHRGNGRSPSDDLATTTMADWATDAAGLARVVGGGEPVVVIGHSYGGFIAQELAIAHPAVVRALVLVATTPGQLGTGEDPAPVGPPVPSEYAPLLAKMPGTDDELARMMNELAPAYLHRAPAEQLRSALAGTVFRVAAMRRGFEELARWSSVDRLPGVEVPVLLVAGRHDAFTAWPQSERIAARLPDAEVVILEGSAHVPWLDEPASFFDAVTTWLTRRGLA
jgi:proline iminopeptidase